MRSKLIIGSILILIGIVSIGFSRYIHSQVMAGQEQIDEAQEQVDMGRKLFSLHPITKEIGRQVTNPIQKKIDEGQHTVDYYMTLSRTLLTGGIIVLLLGAGTALWGSVARK